LFAIGFIVERFLLRPIRDQELYVMCMTIALGQFFEFGARTVWGPLDKAIPPIIPGIIKFAGVAITYKRLMAAIVGIALVIGLYLYIHRTKAGLAMRAVEQDAEVATTYGMGIDRTHALVFSLGSLLAAVAGALMGTIIVVNPVMGTAPMLKSFMIIILGGMGSIPGAIAGGLIVGLMDSFFSSLFGIDIAYIFVFVVAFMFIIFKPRGLWPASTKLRNNISALVGGAVLIILAMPPFVGSYRFMSDADFLSWHRRVYVRCRYWGRFVCSSAFYVSGLISTL
jgi:branched-chain amino acid transport system permease protein